MINNQGTEAKYNITLSLDGTAGIKGSSNGEACYVETQIRLQIVGVGVTNVIYVQGRIRNSSIWKEISTITGEFNSTLDISTYDFVRYVVLVADGIGEIYAAGYLFGADAPLLSTIAPNSLNLPSVRTIGEGTYTPSGLRTRLKITNMTVTDVITAIPLIPLTKRNSIIVDNKDLANSIFIGEITATSSGINQGWEILPNSIFSTDITDTIILYAICAPTKTATLKIMELS